MRKVDIRTRTRELDRDLLNGRATPAKQRVEREQLAAACLATGDHVFEHVYSGVFGSGLKHVCIFCGEPSGVQQQRVARNLSTAF